ncbi:MAG TPA: hypothetical protein V6D08_13300 [Candidatus Obscuribacterales bacterium]
MHDFGLNQTTGVLGNLVNSGTIYGISTSNQVKTAVFQASNIQNLTGALLTTILPEGGLPGFSNALTKLNLSLVAIHNILNTGVISSSGNLRITASNLANQGTIFSSGNADLSVVGQLQNLAGAQLIAQQALNINTPALINSGLISALSGALSITSAGVLSILNRSGAIEALA